MCNTTQDARPALGATIKTKLNVLIAKTGSGIRSSLARAYQKVKTVDKRTVIDRLLANITKLGGQIGGIKDCMLFGLNCSTEKRAAFYATAITILALTAVVVGFTITVATTAKEQDVELKATVHKTSQEVSGWEPKAVFARLQNTVRSFKSNLLSLQTCLIKRQCTKTQKRMLYASAATITALVTAAIGIGIGSYIYAQKQEEEKKRMKEEGR
jgi:uncharacterized protein HemX